MDHVTIYDEYDQPWLIWEDDEIYREACEAQADEVNSNPKVNGQWPKVTWPIRKLTGGRGWGWWSVFAAMEDVEHQLEQLMPNPGKHTLIERGKEYTPQELESLLQDFGGYLSLLHVMLGKNAGSAHALKQGYNASIQVGLANQEAKQGSVTAREGELLADNELLKQTKRMQIQSESIMEMLKGWVDAYENAWNTVSRMITVQMGEAAMSTNRHL